MKQIAFLVAIVFLAACTSKPAADKNPNIKTTLTKTELQDKIKGWLHWQVIGCTSPNFDSTE